MKNNRGITFFWQNTIIVAGIICPLAIIFLVKFSKIPLGIDWQWQRISAPLPAMEIFIAIALFAIAACLAKFMDHRKKLSMLIKSIVIGAILLLGFMVDLQVIQAGRAGAVENVIAVIDKFTTGYMNRAAKIQTWEEYFVNFSSVELKIDPSDPNIHHAQVHPPGNIMLSLGMLKLAENYAWTQDICQSFMPETCDQLKNITGENTLSYSASTPQVVTAACLLIILFTLSVTIGRILLLLTLFKLEGKSLRQSGLATLLITFSAPAPLLFLGHYDIWLFFWSALSCLFIVLTVRSKYRLWWGFLCGITLGIGVLFTLACGAIIVFCYALLLLTAYRKRETCSAIAAVTAGGATVILGCFMCHINIIEICLVCLSNNSGFHAMTGRSVFWPLYNIIECLMFIGIFSCLLPFYRLPSMKFGKVKNFLNNLSLSGTFALTASVIFLILLLSSFSRGELGRLIIFYIPVLLLPTAGLLGGWRLSENKYNIIATGILLIVIQILALRTSLMLVIIS